MKIRAKIGNLKLKRWNMIVEVYQKVWNRCTSKFNTMSRALKSVFLYNMMTSINPTWRTAAILKIVISSYLRHESSEILYADANFDPIDGNVRKIQKFPNSRWRTDAIFKIIFFGYNSAPYCPIKTKFGMRRHNRTRTKVRWWKCQISKIQHGGRPPFWKSL